MDIAKIKGKIDDQLYQELEEHLAKLSEQRDAARQESIEGRKTLKAKVEAQAAALAKALEKLGIDSEADLDSIQGKPATAEAERQMQSRIKRLEADLKDRDERISKTQAQYRDEKLKAQLVSAVSAHPFSSARAARAALAERVRWEGEEALFETDDGKLIAIEDAAAWLAKTEPGLLKAQGAGGSGAPPAGTGGAGATNPWARQTLNLTEQGRLLRDQPQLAAQLKAQAQAA